MPLTLADVFPEGALAVDIGRQQVKGVQADSRRVAAGDVFVAVPGLTVDGHQFVQQAVDAGAIAVVAARPMTLRSETLRGETEIPCFVVPDPACVLGQLSSRLHGEPSRRVALSGITGTNGKTTTAFALAAMLEAAGRTAGLVGTVVYRWGKHSQPASHTTPPAVDLQVLLQRMHADGCSDVVMEVSSHGLALSRLCGCVFRVAAFSNLTQDHLDLHKDMQGYLAAKLRLFSQHLADDGVAVVNLDGAGSDAVIQQVRRRSGLRLIECSCRDARAFARLEDLTTDLSGLRATLHLGRDSAPLTAPLIGAFNAENVLLAAACAHALGVDLTTICQAAMRLPGVPGRLERIDGPPEFAVLVDYAHTPDALARALDVLRPLCTGRLCVVFGCGGDRDRGKRPLMAQAAAERAQLVVLTSDNPRSEDPDAIIADAWPPLAQRLPLLQSVTDLGSAARGVWVWPQRAEAIRAAVEALRSGDILLIAGKGHEDYQIIGTRREHFDDREQARAALAGRT